MPPVGGEVGEEHGRLSDRTQAGRRGGKNRAGGGVLDGSERRKFPPGQGQVQEGSPRPRRNRPSAAVVGWDQPGRNLPWAPRRGAPSGAAAGLSVMLPPDESRKVPPTLRNGRVVAWKDVLGVHPAPSVLSAGHG